MTEESIAEFMVGVVALLKKMSERIERLEGLTLVGDDNWNFRREAREEFSGVELELHRLRVMAQAKDR